jgi:hypothetical protein
MGISLAQVQERRGAWLADLDLRVGALPLASFLTSCDVVVEQRLGIFGCRPGVRSRRASSRAARRAGSRHGSSRRRRAPGGEPNTLGRCNATRPALTLTKATATPSVCLGPCRANIASPRLHPSTPEGRVHVAKKTVLVSNVSGEEIARPGTRKSRPFRFLPLRRRLALAAALVLALTGVGTAFAVGGRLGDLDAFFEFFDNQANDPSIPRLIGDRAVVTRGEDWAFVAWRSTRGLCTSLVFPENQGATGCGLPVVGAPRETRAPEHLIVGSTYHRRPDDDLWVEGVVAANVSRVEVELNDGRPLQAPVYEAPAALGLELKFFLVRTRPPEYGAPKVEVRELLLPVRAFSAYDARGRLLERLSTAAAP